MDLSNRAEEMDGSDPAGSVIWNEQAQKFSEWAESFKDTDYGLSAMLMSEETDQEPSEEHLEQYVSSLMDCVSSGNKSKHEQDDDKTSASLRSLIMNCAEAIEANDVKKAYTLVNTLRDQASISGSAMQRLAHYFAEALVARITGTGSMLVKALSSPQPSIDEFFKTYRRAAEVSPHIGLSVFFTNQLVLENTGMASRVHIVDYGIGHGFRWLCLLKDFSERPGGPPHLRVTGVEFLQHHLVVRGEEIGAKLQRYARQVGVPFEFHLVNSDRWDQVQASELKVRESDDDFDEVLVVTCIYRMRHLVDEMSVLDTPRKRLLRKIHSMKPKLFVHAVCPLRCNSPLFLSRIRSAFAYYSGGFFSFESSFPEDGCERKMIESICGLDLMNLVACEGEERTERAEGYKHWQLLLQRTGFKQFPLRSHVCMKAKEMIQTYHESFKIERHGNWLLIRWKDYFLSALTAWTV